MYFSNIYVSSISSNGKYSCIIIVYKLCLCECTKVCETMRRAWQYRRESAWKMISVVLAVAEGGQCSSRTEGSLALTKRDADSKSVVWRACAGVTWWILFCVFLFYYSFCFLEVLVLVSTFNSVCDVTLTSWKLWRAVLVESHGEGWSEEDLCGLWQTCSCVCVVR